MAALEAAREAIAAAQRDEEWLRHAVDELAGLAPQPDEEERLAQERQRLQQGERHAEAIAAALAELAPRDRRSAAPAAALRAACRALQRLVHAGAARGAPIRRDRRSPHWNARRRRWPRRKASSPGWPREAEADPRLLEQAEERLFALRAAARKHAVAVAGSAGAARYAVRAAGGAGDRRGRGGRAGTGGPPGARRTTWSAAAALACGAADRGGTSWTGPWRRNCRRCGSTRRGFTPRSSALEERDWGPAGTDAVRFLIATNPGQELGPLGRIASGGELSRLMLALKVVLSSGSPVPTLVFDEVDADVGGATAAAVGERLARVAERVQVLVVTHSPQVAARGGAHLRVSKQAARGRTATRVDQLDAPERREEIARMLAGETITEAARAAADDLLGAAAA